MSCRYDSRVIIYVCRALITLSTEDIRESKFSPKLWEQYYSIYVKNKGFLMIFPDPGCIFMISMTSLGDLTNLLVTNFVTKVAQMNVYFLGCKININFHVSTAVVIVWAYCGNFWTTLHFNIWSHCLWWGGNLENSFWALTTKQSKIII